MAEASLTDKMVRPRDRAAGSIISLLQANPDYTYADIKKVIGETYSRKYATGALFEYITERIVSDYVKPGISKRESTRLTQKKVAYTHEQLTLAKKDQLTGLPRRQLFFEVAEAEVRRNGKLNIVMFDLDNFKDVNNNYGHETGDDVLKGFATMLADLFPSAARYGGEEFIIAEPPSVDLNEKLKILQEEFRILVDTTLPNHKDRGLDIGTFSAGVSELTEISNIKEAIERADDALYKSKNDGRNRITSWSTNIPHKTPSPGRSNKI